MNRLVLERRQVWVYLAAIAVGLLAGSAWPGAGVALEPLLWPTLVLLLYAAFVQVPLMRLRRALAGGRLAAAVVIGNFVLMPALAWALVQWLPPDPALRSGGLLVLLVPCTDWFIAFSQLGGGDTPGAVAVTPVNLALQLLLLPLYLWLMAGAELAIAFDVRSVWPALVVVALPLLAALASERWIGARPEREWLRERLGWWPVPLLALVLLLVAVAHAGQVRGAIGLLPVLLPVYVVFLLLAALVARGMATLMSLPVAQGRTLAFSLGSRNSFLVLPLALALPAGWEVAAVVIVVQSLVELFGMAFYLWWVPRRLFR